MSDVLIMKVIFRYLFILTQNSPNLPLDEDETLEKMLELTKSPILLKKFNF
jgi:hypothetical protein